MVRRKPDYNEQDAKARKMLHRMARNLGIPPRKLKRQFKVKFSMSGAVLEYHFSKGFGERYLKAKPIDPLKGVE